ncbi:hypothetical protein F5B19DRAFT_499462 [Rostrohypoxylon terebratum]|nr:hypothetical protein F5B19DRAFT_499462 [Rostrohypoxylon terebratum]
MDGRPPLAPRPAKAKLASLRPENPRGWLWRCTTDRELLIEDAITKGRPVSFDLIGASFVNNLFTRPRSPETRSDKLSFLSEITSEQLSTYTPDQIRTILGQREHVLNVANGESATTEAPPGFGNLPHTKPWVPSEYDECQFKSCARCRPSAESRSYLNLDEVANGHIPPTAAIGFGFHLTGRPVIHPSRLENIGLRAVPMPKDYTTTPPWSESSLETFTCSSLAGETISEAEHAHHGKSLKSKGSSITESVDTEEHCESAALPPWSRSPSSSKEYTKSILFAACLTPLPSAAPEEQSVLGEHSTKMMEEEMEEGRFHKEPLEVDHGVAFSEEAVGLGLADIVTQA